MSSIEKAFEVAYQDMERKGWDRIYVFVDLHSTVIKPSYSSTNTSIDMYEGAKEVLQLLTKREDVVLVMYTCQPLGTSTIISNKFKMEGIVFDYINDNPEVNTGDSEYGNYDLKPYFNVLLDDKAGFEPETDWEGIKLWVEKQ